MVLSACSFHAIAFSALGARGRFCVPLLAGELRSSPARCFSSPSIPYPPIERQNLLGSHWRLVRKAVLGSFNTFCAGRHGILTYAVIPGNSFNAGLSNSMIVSVGDHVCTVVGFIRTWLTTPRNVSFGKASTLNVTAFPV